MGVASVFMRAPRRFQFLAQLALIFLVRESLAQGWNGSVSSVWGNPANWDAAAVPDGVGAIASFNIFSPPPNQPLLGQNRTLTTIQFNGVGFIGVGTPANTLTLDPNTVSSSPSLSLFGPGGFQYNNTLVLDCNVTFGGAAGTHLIQGTKRVTFNNTTTINRPVIINHPETAVTFGNPNSLVPTLTGSAPITAESVYDVVLNASTVPSTYSGTFTIQEGSLHISPFALGNATIVVGNTTGSSHVDLVVFGNGTLTQQIIVAAGNSSYQRIALQGSAFLTLDGTITLGSDSTGKDLTIQNFTGDTQQVNSAIVDPVPLNGTPGVVTFNAYSTFPLRLAGSGSNTHSGGNIVVSGVLELGKTNNALALGPGTTNIVPGTTVRHQSAVFLNQISDAATMNVDGTYDLNGASETIGALTGSGSVLLGSGQLSVGSGADSTFSGVISGAGQLRKTGIGTTLSLTQASTHSGGTLIDQGQLQISNASGSATGTGNVAVNSSGTLIGLGYVAPAAGNNVTVAGGGIVAPGSGGSGLLHLTFSGTGKLQFQSGSKLELKIGTSGQTGLAVNSLDLAGILKLTPNGIVNVGSYTVLTSVVSHTGSFSNVLAPLGLAVQSHGWTGNDYAVVFRTPTIWEAWLQQYWGVDYPINPFAQPSGDQDGDGIPTLLEYAFNLNPLQNDYQILIAGTGQQGLPNIRLGSGVDSNRLVVEYVRRKASTNPDVVYAVLFAGDLQPSAWAANPNAVTTITSIDTNWERVKVVDSVMTTDVSRRFAKVSVTH